MSNPSSGLTGLSRLAVLLAGAGLAAASAASPATAATYQLVASNIVFDNPSPLFTNSTISGVLTLADSIAPGGGFGLGDIGFTFTFGGIVVTSAETMSPGGDITAFGTRSANGATINLLDLRYDLPPTVASCSFICAGQIQIGTFDNSNFVAIDDPDAVSTSLVQFDAALVNAPEPASLSLFGLAIGGIALARRRGRTSREAGRLD